MMDPSRRWNAFGLAVGCGLVVGLTLTARGDDNRPPESVLGARGLRRVGTTYVLLEEEDLGRRLERLERQVDRWKKDRNRLDDELESLGRMQRRYRPLSDPSAGPDRFDGP